MAKEASARIKINKLLEMAGWRFLDTETEKANIQLEAGTPIKKGHLESLGANFEQTTTGFIDFLLLDTEGFPLCVLEAKKDSIPLLSAKGQARKYAHSKGVRFIILSNGDAHYFWDIESGNPEPIVEFPTQASLLGKSTFKPCSKSLHDEIVMDDYVALTQEPDFKSNPLWQNDQTRKEYIKDNGLRILRSYQLNAIHALQKSAKLGNTRFLFEMATGTGKTLTSAGIIKLFLKTGNATRILFLVDRIELEKQAYKDLNKYLKNDYICQIYKKDRENWRNARIVISTVQSLLSQDKYKRIFSPTDFDLVISDEAHRSIGGNSRAVFEYFIGYKLGLTATPKDYLKNINFDKIQKTDPRSLERRELLDTYKTFGCETGEPTYRYGLLEGAREGFLINPTVIDARTDITTQLLSEKGYATVIPTESGLDSEQTFVHTDFEKKFFSEETNATFCKTFLENALPDPISGEIGKTIIFCVSQKHAEKITQILNQVASKVWTDKYNSDFAIQVTSWVQDAQQYPTQFSENNLSGHTRFLDGYKSSKTRICVTVGMMTTGYDCPDLLNIGLMRPIFSPSDFIQIKGRGIRKNIFEFKDENKQLLQKEKVTFKLFDFFATCEYFEEKFKYDEVLTLPPMKTQAAMADVNTSALSTSAIWEIFGSDPLQTLKETPVGVDGMRIDRELFEKAKEAISQDTDIKTAVDLEQWDKAVHILREKYEDKPKLFLTLEKMRKSENLDRRLTWREVLERIFDLIPDFKNKEDLINSECEKYISIYKPADEKIPNINDFIKAYILSLDFRDIVEKKEYARLFAETGFSPEAFKQIKDDVPTIVDYIKNYVHLNTFM